MNAMLIVKTKSGYAVAPYSGELPASFVQDMDVAGQLSSFAYGHGTVLEILREHFEPIENVEKVVTSLKEAA